MREFSFLCFIALFLAYPVLAAEPPTEPPTGATTADVGFPSVGTTWVGRNVPQSGPTVTLTYTVIEDGVYEGKPVHRVAAANDTHLYDIATSNTIATVRFGKEVTSTLPHDGMFSWPLYVGKTWTATYTFNNRPQGVSIGPVNVEYRAAAYEEITVPAGSWKAFKLESEASNSAFSTLWYVPEINLVVKSINETTAGHPWGRTKTVYEMIQYSAPQLEARKSPIQTTIKVGPKVEQPEWQVGYHWQYAWIGPTGKGTFTQEVLRKEAFEGTPVWVIRAGETEELYDTRVLGLLAIKSGDKLVSKTNPPFQLLFWPLEIGKESKINHVLEQVEEKSTRSIDARIVVANAEEMKVPAGTFESYRVEFYDNYTGKLFSEHWYSPKVKWFVKNKIYLANGVQELELLSYSSD